METYGLEKLGIINAAAVYRNLTPAQLTEHALRRGEGTLSNTGALVVKTGKYTGRSANDKFIVDTPAIHDDIAWGKVNRPMDKARFDAIYAKVTAYLQNKDVFIFDGFAGADPKYTKGFRIVNELASQNLFIHQLLRRPTADQLKDFHEDYTIIAAPGFKCIPEIDGTRSEAAVLVDYEAHLVVICGTRYAGEIKKSVFSVMNYVLPKQGVFPMHCSANIGKDGDSAVFFGLSGTGKTTLSADPARKLIGDDEHGWADDSVFNFEGGCYAKCINLSPEGEPEIYNAIRFGSLVENVVMDPETREFDFDDDSLAVNSRVGYPVEYIPNAELSGMSPSVPKTVIFLTADAYGVLPPISKLDKNQAMYYFVSGFTSKVAGTEIDKRKVELERDIKDFGTYSDASCDYPVYGKAVAKAVASGEYERGIIICGTGIGISIAANKVHGIRAALCGDCFSAEATRQHNDANVLALGARVVGPGLALKIVDTFLDTPFSNGERHIRRIEMIED